MSDELDFDVPEKPVLSPKLLRYLADNNPLGQVLEEADVAAWWDSVWPRFVAREYSPKRTRVALLSWWSRLTRTELERARAQAEGRAEEAENARLDELYDELNNVVPIRRRG